jgi:hypothetical protein
MSRKRSFDPALNQIVKPQTQAEEQSNVVVSEAPGSEEGYQKVAWVANQLKMEIPWVYAHARGDRQPHLPSHKLGRYIRFLPSEVMEFAAKHARSMA